MRNPKLKPWLDAGLKKIALKGMPGLNISEIASELETAKSSFYHYFNTKEEYLEQLIEYCEEEGTFRIIKKVLLQENHPDPMQSLIREVFETNFINECFLQQLHSALGTNQAIRAKVEEIEKIRISFLSTILGKSGLSPKESDIKARQFYRFFLGTLMHCNLKAPDKKQQKIIVEDFLSLFGNL